MKKEANNPIESTLAKASIFGGLAEDELQFLARRAARKTFSSGQAVFHEGDPCSGLYVVESATCASSRAQAEEGSRY